MNITLPHVEQEGDFLQIFHACTAHGEILLQQEPLCHWALNEKQHTHPHTVLGVRSLRDRLSDEFLATTTVSCSRRDDGYNEPCNDITDKEGWRRSRPRPLTPSPPPPAHRQPTETATCRCSPAAATPGSPVQNSCRLEMHIPSPAKKSSVFWWHGATNLWWHVLVPAVLLMPFHFCARDQPTESGTPHGMFPKSPSDSMCGRARRKSLSPTTCLPPSKGPNQTCCCFWTSSMPPAGVLAALARRHRPVGWLLLLKPGHFFWSAHMKMFRWAKTTQANPFSRLWLLSLTAKCLLSPIHFLLLVTQRRLSCL